MLIVVLIDDKKCPKQYSLDFSEYRFS